MIAPSLRCMKSPSFPSLFFFLLNMAIKLKLITLLLSNAIINTYEQQVDSSSSDVDDDDDDECAFISGQHCDQNGICKYCAMCLQSSCILSKTIGGNTNSINSCNTTQFGTTNLYNWYDYCLSSDNDNSGGEAFFVVIVSEYSGRT